MIYAPHKIEKRVCIEAQMDEFGRLVFDEYEDWQNVCSGRCDDNDTTSFQSENGSAYIPKYHIVCDGHRDIKAGDYIRCMNGNEIRAEGEVFRVKNLNLMPYTEVWI